MKLHYFPLSTYSQKALIALHEKGLSFTPALVALNDPAARAAYEKLNPLGKVPLLELDDGWKIPESSIIIEYLEGHFDNGTRLIPLERDAARQTRFRDRMADLYVNDPMIAIITDGFKPVAEREPQRVAKARATLDKMYGMLEHDLAGKAWVMGEAFSMADCALAPPLGYAARLHPFEAFPNLRAYAARLRERPSIQRVAAEAAPYLAKIFG
jgi:glutathione S-transferase